MTLYRISAGRTQGFPVMLCRHWDLTGTYCHGWTEGFLDMADVVLLVQGTKLPAHSQFLASQSGVICKLLDQCPIFSKQQPAVIEAAFTRYCTNDIQVFLKHVYSNTQILTAAEGLQLLTASDHFDCPRLKQEAVQYLESPDSVCLKATCEDYGAVHWLQIALQFNLCSLTRRCLNFVTDNHQDLLADPRMQQLTPTVFLEIIQRQQTVIDKRSKVMLDHDTYRYVPYWCCNDCGGHKLEVFANNIRAIVREGARPWCGAYACPAEYTVQFAETSHDFVAILKTGMPGYRSGHYFISDRTFTPQITQSLCEFMQTANAKLLLLVVIVHCLADHSSLKLPSI